jgi:hypothetical protein
MKYPAAEFTSGVPQAQSSLTGMVKDSFFALAFDVAGCPIRSIDRARLEGFQIRGTRTLARAWAHSPHLLRTALEKF